MTDLDDICQRYLGRNFADTDRWWIHQIVHVLQPLDYELLQLHVALNERIIMRDLNDDGPTEYPDEWKDIPPLPGDYPVEIIPLEENNPDGWAQIVEHLDVDESGGDDDCS